MTEAVEAWKRRARQLKTDTYALYLAYRDPRVPWYVKVLAAIVVGYAFSPIDLIPDFIPFLGYLDDLILVPLGLIVAVRLIPAVVWDDCRERAEEALGQDSPRNWVAAAVIVALWLLAVALAVVLAVRSVPGTSKVPGT